MIIKSCTFIFISLLIAQNVYSVDSCRALFAGVLYEKVNPDLSADESGVVTYRKRVLNLNIGDHIKYRNSREKIAEGVIEDINYDYILVRGGGEKREMVGPNLKILEVARPNETPEVKPVVEVAMLRRKAFAKIYDERIRSALDSAIHDLNQQIIFLNSLPRNERENATRKFVDKIYDEVLNKLKLTREQLGFVFNRNMDFWSGSPDSYVAAGGLRGSTKFSAPGKLGFYYFKKDTSLFEIISHSYNQGTLVVFRTDGFLQKAKVEGKVVLAERNTVIGADLIDKEFLEQQQELFGNTTPNKVVVIPLTDFVGYPVSFHEGRNFLIQQGLRVNFEPKSFEYNLPQIILEALLFKYQMLDGHRPE